MKSHTSLQAEKGHSWSQKERLKKIFAHGPSPLSTCHNVKLISA